MFVNQKGFALLGLSLVLVISSFLAISAATKSSANYKYAQNTGRKLDKIRDALISYSLTNGYLPCPASLTEAATNSTFAAEKRASTTACTTSTGLTSLLSDTVYRGLIPTKTLGLSDDFHADDWGNKIEYYVPVAWINSTTNIAGKTSPPINLTDGTGGTASAVPFVVISRGQNGNYGYPLGSSTQNGSSSNTQEQNNTVGNTFFIYYQTNSFDDLLSYVTYTRLITLNTTNQL